MYQYKFVKIELGGFWISARKPKADYHRLIEEQAKEGWRLVQIFAPSVSAMGGGIPEYFELVFERRMDSSW